MASANPGGVAEAIHATLDLFLHDHPGLTTVDVEVVRPANEAFEHPAFTILFDGKPFEVSVREAGNA